MGTMCDFWRYYGNWQQLERELKLDFLRIGVIVASFMSLGTDPVVREVDLSVNNYEKLRGVNLYQKVMVE